MVGVRGAAALSFGILAACMLAWGLPAAAADLIDINTADEATLETLSGIGPSKAQAIIDYRTQNGAFAAIEDIQNVSGIGPATFAKIKDYITVSSAPNSSNNSNPAATTTSDTNTTPSQQTRTAPVSSYIAPPVPSLYADAGSDRTVIVGADVEFDASAYDKDQIVLTGNVRFSWNFGDGSTAEGASVLHHFSYPGRYAVFLNIAQDTSAGTDEVIVTAEPAALSLELLSDGGIAIDDLAGHDLDLSGWIIKGAPQSFAPQLVLPPHSLVLSGSSLRISAATLGFKADPSFTMLEYPNGVFALGMGQATVATSSSVAVKNLAPTSPAAAPHPATPSPKPAASSAPATSSQVAAAAGAVPTSPYLWWLGAFGIASVGAGATYAIKRFTGEHDETRGWDIVEEIAKGE